MRKEAVRYSQCFVKYWSHQRDKFIDKTNFWFFRSVHSPFSDFLLVWLTSLHLHEFYGQPGKRNQQIKLVADPFAFDKVVSWKIYRTCWNVHCELKNIQNLLQCTNVNTILLFYEEQVWVHLCACSSVQNLFTESDITQSCVCVQVK